MSLPRVPLIQAPTPLHKLEHLSAQFGVDLWIKRDDLTGFAFGGNKGRKLEYLLADALKQHADVMVTCGALQSNFVRQLGAGCSMFGLSCSAAVMALPFEPSAGYPKAPPLSSRSGNVLLDEILEVDLHVVPDSSWEDLFQAAEELARKHESRGAKVYRVPVGGSSALGAFAFAEAAGEIPDPFDWVVTASSSGSTQVGLAHALYGTGTRVLGILADTEPEITADFAKLAADLDRLRSPLGLSPEDFHVNTEFVGPGYGVPSRDSQAAIELMARREGIFLDPVYSGKAFAGLVKLVQQGEITGKVLFWHTGGLPTLFA